MLMVALAIGTLYASDKFDSVFVNKTMRIDYFHIADSKEEFFTIDQIYEQGQWAGSLTSLIDLFSNGSYFIKVFDLATGKLIYSKGFNSYCGEYRTTAKALKGIKRSYRESALIPYPKAKIKFVIESRNRSNQLITVFSQNIDPHSIEINREPLIEGVKTIPLLKNGDPHKKVDMAIIAEGYTRDEEDKLKTDFERIVRIFFGYEPYKNLKDRFNVYGVWQPSQQSGCDEPTHGKFKNTSLGATFNALGLYRYMLTEENREMRDIAAHVPYDTVVIMVNHERYGGGGIYNYYCIFTADNPRTPYLFLHEFGHSFAGLADEYYTSAVAYNDFYPPGIEPSEPNITALIDPQNIKWKPYLSKGIELPTDWKKSQYEEQNKRYRKQSLELRQKIARLKKEEKRAGEIEKWMQKLKNLTMDHRAKVKAFFGQHVHKNHVGAFEGAGYSTTGLYRPMLDCIMFSAQTKDYCTVCRGAVTKMIKFYTQ